MLSNQLKNTSKEETNLIQDVSIQKQATTTKNMVKVKSESPQNQLEPSNRCFIVYD